MGNSQGQEPDQVTAYDYFGHLTGPKVECCAGQAAAGYALCVLPGLEIYRAGCQSKHLRLQLTTSDHRDEHQ